MNYARRVIRLVSHEKTEWFAFISVIIILQLFADVAIVLDVPVARQALSFIYLTIIPGTLLVSLIDHGQLDFPEKLLFSVGLSVAFVMFLGLSLNSIGLALGVATLSNPVLLIVLNFAVSFLCVLSYILNKNRQIDLGRLSLSMSTLTVLLPILAVAGTTLVNLNGNSVILLFLIGIITLTVLISAIKTKLNHALILLMISIAVLFYGSLISNYIIGYDVNPAYHVFEITYQNKIWNPMIDEVDLNILRPNQMLSCTIFPAIYSEIVNLEGTWIFKIVYPSIFALVPVGLFRLYRKYMEKTVAFVASFIILADMTFFYELPGLPAQMIGELFLVLALITMFHKKIGRTTKLLLIVIFTAGMIVSHYGISYIFILLVFFTWIIATVKKKTPKIPITYAVLFFAMAFSWYIYTSQSASFASLLEMGENIQRSFWSDLLNPSARSAQALKAVGIGEPAVSIGHWLGRIFHYAVQFLIVIGVVMVVLRRKTNYKFDNEFIVMAFAMLVFALFPLVAPSLDLLNVTRTYHISLLLLAPFCVIGGTSLFSYLSKFLRRVTPVFLVSIIVVALFLFETGFIYEVTGDTSYSTSLSLYRMDRALYYGVGYLMESPDVSGARWFHSNIILNANTMVYADVISLSFQLTSYGVFPREQTTTLSNGSLLNSQNAYVYLRAFNIVDGKIYGVGYSEGRIWNTSDLNPQLMSNNKIYTNGGTEIYFIP